MDEQILNDKPDDPFDYPRWPLAQAAAWIIWRSREYVAQLLLDIAESEGRVQVFDIFNEAARRENGRGGPPEGGVLPFVEAQAELWEQLRQGRLAARGVKVGEAIWSHIPRAEWSNLDYFPCTDGRSNSIGSNHSAVYDGVTVARTTVLKLWPDMTKVKARPKSGRKLKIGLDHLKSIVFKLMCEHGDIMDPDPSWRVQRDIEHATHNALLLQKFNTEDIPKKTQLRTYVSRFYQEWKDEQ
jgi:hypothetical protein